MAMRCDMCGKGFQTGNAVPHSKHRTKKSFKPNLQNKTVVIDGQKKKLKLCAKCLKTL